VPRSLLFYLRSYHGHTLTAAVLLFITGQSGTLLTVIHCQSAVRAVDVLKDHVDQRRVVDSIDCTA